ncbi:hypothetical protein Ae201684_003650 [Aphanomyces euteiches]|uniref:Uncharacterized protein n=1 Tax=Aphanomyces euteiches TaxID=100861 RepID=A0A6G0XL32_9STRA|nr:hypothetical protein Ae201684_003650 [Aphanomyces euteiches]KAH9151778.1 hypothetical protein AeRB84_005680 [Aphanomyces euteiches]
MERVRTEAAGNELDGMLQLQSQLLEPHIPNSRLASEGLTTLAKVVGGTLKDLSLLTQHTGDEWSDSPESIAAYVDCSHVLLLQAHHQLGALTLHALRGQLQSLQRIEALEAKLEALQLNNSATPRAQTPSDGGSPITSSIAVSAIVSASGSSPAQSTQGPIKTPKGKSAASLASTECISIPSSSEDDNDPQDSDFDMPDEGNQRADDVSSDESSTDSRQSRYTQYFESTQVVGTQESKRYRTAFKADLCDHLYPNGDRCQTPRDQWFGAPHAESHQDQGGL